MFDSGLFQETWESTLASSSPYVAEIREFVNWVVQNELTVEDRFQLATNSDNAQILSKLAFDKAHKSAPGDIRVLVAKNSHTSLQTLDMLANGLDRLDWNWEDWLDYENDDWSQDVELVADYGSDIAQEITDMCQREARVQMESRKISK